MLTLTVEDPGVPASVGPVYATISPKRTLDKNGYLKTARGCSGRCDFVKLHHWKGHPGMWIYKSTYNFPGYWAVTPGRYYWQANHVAEKAGTVVGSARGHASDVVAKAPRNETTASVLDEFVPSVS